MAISAIKQKAASSNRNQMKDGSGIVHGSLARHRTCAPERLSLGIAMRWGSETEPSRRFHMIHVVAAEKRAKEDSRQAFGQQAASIRRNSSPS